MGPASRVYFACESAIRATRGAAWRLGRVASAAYSGFFLGLFDSNDSLNAVTGGHYLRFGTRYIEGDYNRSGLKSWERDALDRYFADVKSVIVTSAGGGREVLALAERGMHVSAFECSPKFIDFCRAMLDETGVQARVVETAPGEVPDLGRHDGIVVGWGAYMHIPGSGARVGFLQKLRAQIAPGGPLLLSCELRKPGGPRPKVIAAIANLIRRLRGKQFVELGDELKGWYCHIFTEDELRSEFQKAGFRLEYCSDKGYGHAVGIAV